MRDIFKLLDPSLRDRAKSLREQFRVARPFRHLIIDGFLAGSFCERLIADFPPFAERYVIHELEEGGGKAVISALSKISPSYAEFDGLMRTKAFLSWLGEITSIEGLLYPRDHGGGTHENRDGQELDWHVDSNYHPTLRLHRRLNLILFLNPEWKLEWGGCLEFPRNPWGRENIGVSIVPVANRCVIFETTESSWHGFRRIRLPEDGVHRSRRSLATYFYTSKRPVRETAPRHGTIYVPPGLSPQLAPGYTLRPRDMENLEALLARRDHQIRYLYDRELALSGALTAIHRSASFRIGRAITWPLRKLFGVVDPPFERFASDARRKPRPF